MVFVIPFYVLYSGAYILPKEKQKEVIPNQDLTQLEPKMMVALDYEKYSEHPLIREVREVKQETILRVWYRGN